MLEPHRCLLLSACLLLTGLPFTTHAHMRPSPIERFDLQSRIVLQGDETARTELSAREGFEFPDLDGSRQSVAWLLRRRKTARPLPPVCWHLWVRSMRGLRRGGSGGRGIGPGCR